MKKIKNILIAMTMVFVLGTATSCKSQLEDKYLDPEQTATPNIRAFLSQMLTNSRLRSEYWHYRTFILMHQARYTQTTFFTNANGMYQQNDSYINGYWNDFYGPGLLGVYRAMERAYADLSDTEKAELDPFMYAARVVLYDQASKLVDNFGDIPFSEAGSLPKTDQISLAKFDSQTALYAEFIEGLKSAGTFFKTYRTTADFTRADILNGGVALKWQKYANSLRLRLLMRTSHVNESTARTEIMEMLNNPADYPLVDGDNSGNYTPTSDVLLAPLSTYTSSLLDALRELPSHYAPDYMLNTVLNTSNDPRIPVLFDKFGKTVNNAFVQNPTYRAMPITFSQVESEQQFQDYAVVDSATAWINNKLPGVLMTASEVNFIKAEALERWGSTADAKLAYETAVRQSVSFYYYLNNTSTHASKVTTPVDSVITAFVTQSNIAYTGTPANKLQLIGTQKWVHFGWLQGEQAWSEYRRTKYPVLPAFPVDDLNGFERPPVRLLYPSSEITNNSDNYSAVQAKDTRDTKIFWDVK
ncbi:SusD/RagB family nutrient-binding outer membrane lipoprotein [Sphingobacterium paludis]|nr:SusD/RagB family nutrient-binding outer membrane lipoprotein [Sphingobacterium paludis]